jgi:acyl-CoA thioester hydrolase
MAKREIQLSETLFHHRQPVQVRFNDIDVLGHLNNSVYFEFFDLAKLNYFIDVLGDAFNPDVVGLAVVNVNCDFMAQAFITEQLEVVTAVTSISERSLRLEQRLINVQTGQVKSVCRAVMAGFDVKNASSAPISDEWRARMNKFENRELKA